MRKKGEPLTILVIGSRGTIGRKLTTELRYKGHAVYEADDKHCDLDRYARVDIREYRQVAKLWNCKPDLVYMLAAEFGRHNGELFYEQCWSTNVIGGRHVMEACVANGTRLIFITSSEVYGETPQQLMCEADTENYPLRHHNDYAMSKWVNEQQILNMEREKGLQCVRVRLFNAYGPGEEFHPFRSVVCLFVHNALTKQPYTVYEDYTRAFTYIDDTIRTLGIIPIAFIPGRVYNIGSDECRPVADVDTLIRKTLGLSFRSDVEYMPKDGHNTVNKRPSISAAKRELGHTLTVRLEEGIPLTIKWMRQWIKSR